MIIDSTLITLIKNSSIIFDVTVQCVFDSIIYCSLCYFKIYDKCYRYLRIIVSETFFHLVAITSSRTNKLESNKVI